LGGDEVARDALLARHYASLNRFFEAEVGSAAPDLTQCTMLACVRAIHSFQRRSSFRTYLFAIARRQLAYYLRQERRRRSGATFDDATYQAHSFTTPSRVVLRREEQTLLMYALQQLPLDQRITFELFYWEAMSNREIAEVLDVKVSTVTTRLQRARNGIFQRIADMRPSEFTAQQLVENLDGWMRSLAHGTPA
jgi:RNA polymerase sigma-70 factor (ECF subfamily)